MSSRFTGALARKPRLCSLQVLAQKHLQSTLAQRPTQPRGGRLSVYLSHLRLFLSLCSVNAFTLIDCWMPLSYLCFFSECPSPASLHLATSIWCQLLVVARPLQLVNGVFRLLREAKWKRESDKAGSCFFVSFLC